MPKTPVRKAACDAILAWLSNPATGFNWQLLNTFGIPVNVFGPINWTLPSPNFARIYASQEILTIERISELVTFPGALLYSTRSQDTGEQKGSNLSFSGVVEVCFDVYTLLRRGATATDLTGDTETLADAIHDAALLALKQSWGNLANGVNLNRDISCERGPLVLYGDGYGQRVPIIFTCEVNL